MLTSTTRYRLITFGIAVPPDPSIPLAPPQKQLRADAFCICPQTIIDFFLPAGGLPVFVSYFFEAWSAIGVAGAGAYPPPHPALPGVWL